MQSLFDGQPASSAAEPSPPRNGRAKPKPAAEPAGDVGKRLADIFGELSGASGLDVKAVQAIVDASCGKLADRVMDKLKGIKERVESIKAPKPDRFVVVIGDVAREIPETAHAVMGSLLKLCSARDRNGLGLNIMLVGPAGCGKTHAVAQAARALDTPFGCLSLSGGTSECHLFGRFLPTGDGGRFEYTEAPFVTAYRTGGLFCLDEMDAADPNVLVAANAALANGHITLPNGETIERHADFVCIACANTYGNGADRQYVGRMQQDAATLDRFAACRLAVDYDPDFERSAGRDDVTDWAHSLRERVRSAGLRRVVSSRFILQASDLIDGGACTLDECKRSLLLDWSDADLSTIGEVRP